MQKAINHYKPWRQGELDFLCANPSMPVKKLAEMLGRTAQSVEFKRLQVGIKHGTVPMAYGRQYRQTLCWQCVTPILRCPWMGCLAPVPGWLATPSRIESPNQNTQMNSFCVHECPLYEDAANYKTKEAAQC